MLRSNPLNQKELSRHAFHYLLNRERFLMARVCHLWNELASEATTFDENFDLFYNDENVCMDSEPFFCVKVNDIHESKRALVLSRVRDADVYNPSEVVADGIVKLD